MDQQGRSASILFWLRQAYFGLRQDMARGFKEAGYPLSTEQWSILADLWQFGRSNQSEIAKRTGRDAPAITRLLSGLEEEGLLEREPVDRRTNNVELTKRGKELHRLLAPIFQQIVDQRLAEFSDEETQNAYKILRSIAKGRS